MSLPDDLIGDAEARAILGGIPAGTLASMRHRRQIPFFRLGGGRLVRYSRRELLEYVAAHRVPAQVRAPDELAEARAALKSAAAARSGNSGGR